MTPGSYRQLKSSKSSVYVNKMIPLDEAYTQVLNNSKNQNTSVLHFNTEFYIIFFIRFSKVILRNLNTSKVNPRLKIKI